MNDKFNIKILPVLFLSAMAFLGVSGFSCVRGCEKDFYVTAETVKEEYTRTVDDLLDRGNDDEMSAFWFDCIDNDNDVLLDIFFNRLDYPDQNFLFYLNDEFNRTSLERAMADGRVAVTEYLSRVLYG